MKFQRSIQVLKDASVSWLRENGIVIVKAKTVSVLMVNVSAISWEQELLPENQTIRFFNEHFASKK